MKQIKLRKELLDKVRTGAKRSSIRRGIKDYTVGPARLVNPDDASDFVDIFILGVNLYTWKGIQEDDTLCSPEGYASPQELQEALIKIYGEMEKTEAMTLFFFTPYHPNGLNHERSI